MTMKTSGISGADHIVPYGTALSGDLSRHFVPGYDHTVPLGRNLRAEAFIKLALMGLKPRAEYV
jgi:hypothetical protein